MSETPKSDLSENNGKSIEYRILTPSNEDLDFFSEILNKSWGSFFNVDEDMLQERFESNDIFVGAYCNEKPAGILETISIECDAVENSNPLMPEEKAAFVCSQIGDYRNLTNSGRWRPVSKNSNVLVFVDVTVSEEYRGTPIASGMIELSKKLLSKEPRDRMEQLKNIEYAVTFTPNHEPIKRWHEKQYARDTRFVRKNARLGHKLPDVNFMCYMAPGFLAQYGQKEAKKE
jgi:hypothetical protein